MQISVPPWFFPLYPSVAEIVPGKPKNGAHPTFPLYHTERFLSRERRWKSVSKIHEKAGGFLAIFISFPGHARRPCGCRSLPSGSPQSAATARASAPPTRLRKRRASRARHTAPKPACQIEADRAPTSRPWGSFSFSMQISFVLGYSSYFLHYSTFQQVTQYI